MTDRLSPPRLRPDLALFLDFDGTLAPIQDDPETVRLPEDGADVLRALALALGGALAIVSGRGLGDLSGRVPVSVWRAGAHGLDIRAPGDTSPAADAGPPDALVRAILALVAPMAGVRVEPKGAVLAVHYRAAPDQASALAKGLAELVDAFEGYKLQHGKMVFEAKPVAADKGRAVADLLRQPGFAGRVPVMVGDDTTDEDAMAVVNASGGWAVKVGEGATLATYRLADPEEVWTWLRQTQ